MDDSTEAGSGWVMMGLLMLLAAIGMVWSGLSMEVTVEVPGRDGYPSLGIPSTPETEVVNFSLLTRQVTMVVGGLSLFVASMVCFGVQSIRDAIYRRTTAPEAAPVAVVSPDAG